MTQIIFSDEKPKGWIPPSIAAPFICIFLVAISSLPFDFGLEYLGFTDAKGSPHGPLGFCLLLVSFITIGLAVFGWVRWVEKRSLASVGFRGEQRLKSFLIGLAVGMAMMGAIVTAIALSGGYRVADLAPAFASPAARVRHLLPVSRSLVAGLVLQDQWLALSEDADSATIV